MRCLCAFIVRIISFSGNDETEFTKKLNFVKPQLMAFARASYELREKTMPAWNLKRCLESQPGPTR